MGEHPCAGCGALILKGKTKPFKWCYRCKPNGGGKGARFLDRERACDECGEIFLAKDRRGRFCCSRCRSRYVGRGRGRLNADRRARLRTEAYVEEVPLGYIAERDRWRCHLCGKKVFKTRKWPHPDSPTRDHIVPVSKGGEHSKANVALAHLRCNLMKNNGAQGEQLRLLG